MTNLKFDYNTAELYISNYNSKLAQGYNEIKESEFEQARDNAKA